MDAEFYGKGITYESFMRKALQIPSGEYTKVAHAADYHNLYYIHSVQGAVKDTTTAYIKQFKLIQEKLNQALTAVKKRSCSTEAVQRLDELISFLREDVHTEGQLFHVVEKGFEILLELEPVR